LYKIALDRFLYGPAFNFIMMAFVFKARARARACADAYPSLLSSAGPWDRSRGSHGGRPFGACVLHFGTRRHSPPDSQE